MRSRPSARCSLRPTPIKSSEQGVRAGGDEALGGPAAAAGAAPFLGRLPRGYETRLHERGRNLSVGQRQLVAFARAIVAEPRILVLDEATATVDTQTERTIQQALQTLLAGRTSFVIAHRLSTVAAAHAIYVMDHGRVVESGRHEELVTSGGLYSVLHREQFGPEPSAEVVRHLALAEPRAGAQALPRLDRASPSIGGE